LLPEECVLECPNGYLQDSHGNKLCECSAVRAGPTICPTLTGCQKNCSHGFRLNKMGCEICRCKECRPLMDCNKTCVNGLRTNDRGCPICKCKGLCSLPQIILFHKKQFTCNVMMIVCSSNRWIFFEGEWLLSPFNFKLLISHINMAVVSTSVVCELWVMSIEDRQWDFMW
jgi:hypothetical protein